MADVLALEYLYDAVDARFTLEGYSCARSFGWREPEKHKTTTRRIVWVPGDPSDAVGSISGARFPGRNPRPIGTLDELFTVYIGAADPTDPENERAAYHETRLAFDAWWRAVYLAAHGTVEVVSAKWNNATKERRYGAELIVVCSIQAMIPDVPASTVGGPDDPNMEADIVPSIGSTLDGAGTDDPTIIAGGPIPQAVAASTGPLVLFGPQTVDGVAVVNGDYVLVKDQATASENGRYIVEDAEWALAPDTLELGFHVHTAAGGVVNGDAGFEVTSLSPLTFERVSP